MSFGLYFNRYYIHGTQVIPILVWLNFWTGCGLGMSCSCYILALLLLEMSCSSKEVSKNVVV